TSRSHRAPRTRRDRCRDGWHLGCDAGSFMTTRLALLSLLAVACESSTSRISADGGSAGDADATPTADAAPGPADAGGSASALGTVSELDDPCPAGAGSLPGTRCQLVEVSCPGIPALRAQV